MSERIKIGSRVTVDGVTGTVTNRSELGYLVKLDGSRRLVMRRPDQVVRFSRPRTAPNRTDGAEAEPYTDHELHVAKMVGLTPRQVRRELQRAGKWSVR